VGNFLRPFSDSLYHGYDRVENHEELRTYLTDLYHKNKDQLGYNDFYANAYTTFAVDTEERPEFDLINLPLFAPLRKIILNRSAQLVDDQVTYNSGSIPVSYRNRPLKFSEFWFNVNPPGAYQGKHHHADNLLGGTYYIQVPKDTGAIRFYNPNNFANYKLFSGERTHLMKLTADLVPTDGQLLVWPGFLEHEVTTNLSTDGIRISVSWGIDWV
jgi:uncharacterized protein (TIGR02466 family)